MDDTIADMTTPWIVWINRIFGTSFNPRDGFPVWRFDKHPAFAMVGGRAFDFVSPYSYDKDIIAPFPGALEAVDTLRLLGYPIRFVTSCINGTQAAKLQWLKRHGFIVDETEFLPLSDKSEAPVHILVDDGFHNVEAFRRGLAILVNRAHNKNEHWHGLRINHVSELIHHLR